jgi:4-amino-4-deoxy-L-arabinose transferase-like glycosyltransferase
MSLHRSSPDLLDPRLGRLDRLSARVYVGLFAGTMLLAGVLRFWSIGSRPGYEWDEPVYTNIAANAVRLGSITIKPEYGVESAPYLFHPPFYFLELGGWFSVTGVGITQARILGAVVSLLGLAVLYCLLREIIGRLALVAVALVAVDGWLVFTQRVSWIENSLLVLMFLALWFYYRATQRPTIANYVLAGFWLGAATMFKYLGVYVVVATLIDWCIERRDGRKYVVMFLTTAATIAVYVAVMLLIFQDGTRNVFWDDSTVQFKRTVGLHESRGTLSSLRDYVVPLLHRYRVFAGTMLVALGGILLLLFRLGQCAWSRSLAPVRPNSLLFSWALAGLISFGSINLKFPHYFELLLIPLYAYLVAEVARIARHAGTAPWRRQLLAAAAAAVVVLGLCAFGWRIVGQSDNALKDVADYAGAVIPRDAVVITEETIGTIIPQPYAKMYRAGEVAGVARYIITYESQTQRIPTYPALRDLLRRSTRVAVFKGFKEKLTVWRIDDSAQAELGPANGE